MAGDFGSKAIRLLSSVPMTYADLERELGSSADVREVVRGFRRSGRVKRISAGCRQVLFVRESQRRSADIMALGKHAFQLYNIINDDGPLRTYNLTDRMGGLRADHLRKSLDNLVANGYVKRMGTLSSAAGHLYYTGTLTKSQKTLCVIGISEERAYEVIRGAKRPVTSAYIAKEMGVSVFNAAEISGRVVDRGLAYKSSLGKGSRNEKIRTSMYYADRRQGKLASVLSASPTYGEAIYGALSRRPKSTAEVAEATGIERGHAYQVLKILRNHGIIGHEIAGRKLSRWYVLPK